METPSNYKVEVLSPEYFEWFTEVAAVKMLVEEVQRPHYVNLERIKELALKGMMEETAIIVRQGDIPVGALGALLLPNTFNPTITSLVEFLWYVLPEHRKSRAGLLLLNKFEQMATDIADEAHFSLLSTSEVGRKSMEKKGFEFKEQVLYKKY